MELVAYSDGGSRGNPGVAGSGWVLYSDVRGNAEGRVILDCGTWYCGDNVTNNVAEYQGAINAVRCAKAFLDRRPTAASPSAGTFELRTDSKLVVGHVTGTMQCRAEHLCSLLQDLRAQLDAVGQHVHTTVRWVPREQNSVADYLSNVAMDRRKAESGTYLLEAMRITMKPKAKGTKPKARASKCPAPPRVGPPATRRASPDDGPPAKRVDCSEPAF